MRVQDFLGWLVPAYVIALAAPALIANVLERRWSQLWIPVGGLVLGYFLVRDLRRRRREWLPDKHYPPL